VNVKQFGAEGDGKTDDSKAIQAAMEQAKRKGSTLYFPTGIFLVSNIEITTDLKGEKNTIIKKIDDGKLSRYVFCNIRNQDSLHISDITFDGSVQTDTKGEPTTGSIPLFIYNSNYIEISNCTFMNSPMSGLRIESSSHIKLSSCTAKGSKGNFGDGFYFDGSHFVNVEGCTADDYTRIGFVTEQGSSDFIFKNCTAMNGHNASILTGGREYNAGFWYENSQKITTISCTSTNNTHIGFVATTGKKVESKNLESLAEFKFTNCVSNKSPIGFQLSSSGKAVNMILADCQVNDAARGYIATARDVNDQFDFRNCKVSLIQLSTRALNNMGFMWESPITVKAVSYKKLPTFNYKNCYVHYEEPVNSTHLFDRNNNNGDISTYTGGKANINVVNLRNSLRTGNTIIKARRGSPTYNLKRTKADPRFIKK